MTQPQNRPPAGGQGFRAGFSPGQNLSNGEGRPLSVRGGLLFREWDEADQEFYLWEEWQIAGFDHHDMWVELDHDGNAVYLYEPLAFSETLDPVSLQAGQSLTLTSGWSTYQATVTSLGNGVLVAQSGTTTCTLPVGEVMGYAELSLLSEAGERRDVTVDTHGFRDIVTYTKRPLSLREQRHILGAPVVPAGARARTSRALVWLVVIACLIGALSIVLWLAALNRAVGDEPRGSETSTSQPGRSRPIYGGGGSGVGK